MRRFPSRSAALLLTIVALAVACSNESPGDTDPATIEARRLGDVVARSAGQATTFERGPLAFSTSGRTLGLVDRIDFFDGRDVFDHPFTVAEGLGPIYNDLSCAACHIDNGRSPAPDSDLTPGSVLRVENQDDLQLQTQAIAGYEREDWFNVDWVETGDGLRMPTYESGTPLGSVAVRVSPPLVGLGLLEAIPADAIRAQADPDDLDGDGVSGRLSILDDGTLGRFGWQATSASIDEQTGKALTHDIGVELSDEARRLAVLYVATLAVPGVRDATTTDVRSGAAVFADIGCGSCHTGGFTTGESSISTSLEGHVIYPYTDLLLHDMGDGLADFSGSEWRTQPLWGLGLTETVLGESSYLHDGRARTIDEAIRWHGGEAASSVSNYLNLEGLSRTQLLAFLDAL